MHPDEIVHQPHMNEKVSPAGSVEKCHGVHGHHDQEKLGGQIAQVPTHGTMPEITAQPTAERDPYLGRGKPSRAQWGLFTPSPNPWKTLLIDLWVPWKLFAFPIVEFAAFVVSWSCSSFLTLNLTQSQNFAAPPYNYNSQTIGFFNFAVLVGAMIGLATAGPFSDWVSARATRRNRGIREPEMRLPAMSQSHRYNVRNLDILLTVLIVPYVLIMMLGNFIVAFGYENKWSWKVIVVIGYTCAGIQVAALPALVTTYAVDSYKPVAGSVMVAITVNKNVWGYGFSEFITAWIEKSGYVPPIMTNMALITLWCLFGIVFYYFGKTFRSWSKNDSVHRM